MQMAGQELEFINQVHAKTWQPIEAAVVNTLEQ